MTEWYYAKGNDKHGPVSSKQLKQLARTGELLPTDLVWKEGAPDWKPAKLLNGLFPETKQAPTPSLPHRSSLSSNDVEPVRLEPLPADVNDVGQTSFASVTDESILYIVHPNLFRRYPIQIVILLIFIPSWFITLPLTVALWLQMRKTMLTITPTRTIWTQNRFCGISIFTKVTEVLNRDVRNISATIKQRKHGSIGDLTISTGGRDYQEIFAYAIPTPNRAREIILENGGKTTTSQPPL